ncbi:hypothetical protein M409DRAFT_53031 [Zasmidium cellare ATCC 36951]|uniref:Presequence translocated-associated motor subunit PAM17 n=1 Tax=Zasmidium cellare ATCC 36951 TaxID=1080233 RepID=A0A6A6CP78_ZASCE|nr:uncharacterized protein M409DRAFT_53031 [Zasmidium cellare ATCC 36951]KAF2169077.1 hypothetical protein M409DRAFT_53031 [Zasmidium cellare ATCC 36951]
MATLLCTRTTCLRSLSTAPRTFSLPAKATVAFSTARPSKHPSRTSNNKRPSITSHLSKTQTTKHGLRQASSTSTTSHQEPPPDLLTWDRFFDLRRKRRFLNVGCSAVTAVAAVGVVTPIIANQDFDSWGAQISGMDPIVVFGISTFAVAAGGWLCGPSFGTALFSLWAGRRGWNKLIAEKEKSFYARIKRYRADASASSPQNPIPDYYGEKIASVKDYRRWLKDQKAFNLKKNKNMI